MHTSATLPLSPIQHIRTQLRSGKKSLGSWLQLPSADTAEIMAHMGYDWLVIDMEHGSIDIRDLPNIIRAIQCGGQHYVREAQHHKAQELEQHIRLLSLSPTHNLYQAQEQTFPLAPASLVRVPHAETMFIRRALDAGAEGLIFPMIRNYTELESAIDATLYPHPTQLSGRRGVGYARANTYGKDFVQYTQNTAQEILLVAQIEHIDAVHELEAIVQHPRLDAIMMGPYDLSASMGIMGQFTHPLFKQAMQEVHAICQKHSMPHGTHIVPPSPQALQQAYDAQYAFIAYGTDALFLQQGGLRPHID